MALANRLRQARGERRVIDVASAAGLSSRAVYRIESGQGSPTAETLVALAAVLEVDAGWLLRGAVVCEGCGQVEREV